MAAPAANLFTYPPPIELYKEVLKTLFLEGSGLKQEWIDFIKDDTELHSSLRQAVSGLVTYFTDYMEGENSVIPVPNINTLAALRYCKPAEVKVIILGHDPIPDHRLATGLAFSLPNGVTSQNISSLYGTSGTSVERVHEALQAAGFTPGDSLNHEHWAERGVLLLNACLTIDPDNKTERKTDGSDERENPHFKHWKNFTCQLLRNLLLLHQNRKDAGPPIFVLCWGTHARDVRNYLEPYLQPGYRVVEYDGDHSELQQQLGPVVIASGHHPMFPRGSNGENKFLTQAQNQFTAIRRNPQYSTLFN